MMLRKRAAAQYYAAAQLQGICEDSTPAGERAFAVALEKLSGKMYYV